MLKQLILCTLLLPAFAVHGGMQPPFHRIQLDTPEQLRQLLEPSDVHLPLVSAHRGGAVPGYPENCIATFENTLRHTWAILEVDVRTSSDGHYILHHDAILDRTTTGSGPIKDHTLAELRQLRLVDNEGTVTDYRMPTLAEAIEWARGKVILILDRKDTLRAEPCVRIIQQHRAQAFVMIMTYNMEDIKTIHRLDPDIMMEVFMGTRERFDQFDATGVPWDRIVAFISHQPPGDRDLTRDIRRRGASTIAGTSRYLDRELKAMGGATAELVERYQQLLDTGIDIIETDLPGAVAEALGFPDQSHSPVLAFPVNVVECVN